MGLVIHHLGRPQSERVIWLCEELGLAYGLEMHARDPVTMLSPPGLRAMHPMGAAPVLVDGDVVLAESGAIFAYILARHGGGRLEVGAGHPDFARYLYWLHFANGSLQPAMGRSMVVRRLGLPAEHPVVRSTGERLGRALGWLEARLEAGGYLAGGAFTAADIMTVFSLTTMRLFMAVELGAYPAILAYLERVGSRPAYQAAMARGDQGFAPMLR